MNSRDKLGLALAVIGALLGLFGSFIIFTQWYEPMMAAEIAAGRPDEEIIVKFIIPVLNDIGMVAGALWAVAAFGYAKSRRWAWPVSVVASVLALQGSFFPMIPAASRGLPPMFGLIFVPSLLIYVALLWFVGRVNWRILVFSLFAGIAFVLSFMNGVASTDRIMVIGTPLYVAVQRLNWLASIAWGVFTVGLILKPAEWVRMVGLGAGILEMVVGYPLGLATTLSFGHFSMFFPAPILSTLLVLVILFAWDRVVAPFAAARRTPARVPG